MKMNEMMKIKNNNNSNNNINNNNKIYMKLKK